jgi:UDP-hydrolysing UDP-N-acetyl-D-glucosamine 2-epimerase
MSIEGENPQTMAQSVGLGLVQLAPIISRLDPDVVVTVADRFETLATAIAASYMNKTLAHIQGGELTGTIDESVRHAITKMSHLHFASTEESRKRVISMGENPKYVFNTGCPSIDLAKDTDTSKERLQKINLGGLGKVDLSKPYILVMQHPVTTEFGQGTKQITETLQAIQKIGIQTIMLWPNPDAGSDDISKAIRIFREKNHFPASIQFFKNIEPEDYATVLANAACAIGNSSSFIRESSFLGTPTVLVGSRQQHREHGKNCIYAEHDSEQIFKAAMNQINHGRYKSEHIYGKGDAGSQIADLIWEISPPVQKEFYE